MAKRRRSGAPKLKGSFTLATSMSGPVFFDQISQITRSISIGPKTRAGPQQSPNNRPDADLSPAIVASLRHCQRFCAFAGKSAMRRPGNKYYMDITILHEIVIARDGGYPIPA
ncbi:hypothetical protein [Mesorhizobium sp. ES1-4]|uniref:hypothetical protein n=1 Tax=Mesorhizobium sp. ES1-4 TaxID=2876627 RepID=UPI001CCF0502|nr:hypothetical protein [Mesorhizobium sp. ES1-4]MBZ9796837.1 hypothetical protein [Mesorhizobium sp. ES1-4]